jgi:hypothetical protein
MTDISLGQGSPSPSDGRRWLRPLVILAGFSMLALLLYRAGWTDLVTSFQRLGFPALLVLLGLGVV